MPASRKTRRPAPQVQNPGPGHAPATPSLQDLQRQLVAWDSHLQTRPHGTGLVDYGLWVRLFEQLPSAPDEPYERGLIWS